MKINTRQGNSYAVTSAAGATITNENGVVLLAAEPGAQGVFVATGMYVECDDEAAQVTEMSSGGGAGSGGGGGGTATAGKSAYELAQEAGFAGSVSEWLASLKGEPGEPGRDGAPGEKGEKGEPGSVDEEQMQEAADRSVEAAIGGEVSLAGPDATDNANVSYFQLGSSFLRAGVELSAFGYRVRFQSVSDCATTPCYLGVWEQAEGGASWVRLGVSEDAQVQAAGEELLWRFAPGAIRLSGRPLRFVLLAAQGDAWRTDLLMGVRCSRTSAADTFIFSTAQNAYVVKFTLRGYAGLSSMFTPKEHMNNNTLHLTEEEHAALTELLENKEALLAAIRQ